MGDTISEKEMPEPHCAVGVSRAFALWHCRTHDDPRSNEHSVAVGCSSASSAPKDSTNEVGDGGVENTVTATVAIGYPSGERCCDES